MNDKLTSVNGNDGSCGVQRQVSRPTPGTTHEWSTSRLTPDLTRRGFLAASAAAAIGLPAVFAQKPNEDTAAQDASRSDRDASRPTPHASRPSKARIAITLDLEMSRHYPQRGMMEWDFQKGNLDEPTKQYAVEAARLVRERGGLIHFFCVGRVLEQENVDWLRHIHEAGHPIGNHTYDHVNVTATEPEQTQFRFQRSPWLVRGKTAKELIQENILTTNIALKQRLGITANGFRTPGGFNAGLSDRPDLQQMLLDLGFTWISSKYPAHDRGQEKQQPPAAVYDSILAAQRESQPFLYPNGLVEVPMSPISDVTAFRATFWKLDYFLKAVRLAVEQAIETRTVFDFLAHPSCLVVEDPKFETIKLICDLVNHNRDRAEIVGLDTIAKQTTGA
jgi:peptidoglycan/xylan/chitin deacetylase (PgdA/CDA1 family)